jgi:hypothetical protein
MAYGGKTHKTDSKNSDTTAPSGRELFSLQAASPETFGYTFSHPCTKRDSTKLSQYSSSQKLRVFYNAATGTMKSFFYLYISIVIKFIL